MHDAKNRPLKPGDRVFVPAIVKDVAPGEDYCNVTLTSALGRRPDSSKEVIGGINTGIVLLANEGDENDLAESFGS